MRAAELGRPPRPARRDRAGAAAARARGGRATRRRPRTTSRTASGVPSRPGCRSRLRCGAPPRRDRSVPAAGVRAGVAAAALLRAGTAALDAGAAERRGRDAAPSGGRRGPGATIRCWRRRCSARSAAPSCTPSAARTARARSCCTGRSGSRGSLGARARSPRSSASSRSSTCRRARHGSAGTSARRRTRASSAPRGRRAAGPAARGRGHERGGPGPPPCSRSSSSAGPRASGRAGQERQRIWSLGVLARSLLLLERVAEARAPRKRASPARSRSAGTRSCRGRRRSERSARRGPATGWPRPRRGAGVRARLRARRPVLGGHGGSSPRARRGARRRRRTARGHGRSMPAAAATGCRTATSGSRLHRARAARDRALDAPGEVAALAARLHDDALRTDLPEFQAWAMVRLAGSGDPTALDRAPRGQGVDSPGLQRALHAARSAAA